jgi:hypothetical protein
LNGSSQGNQHCLQSGQVAERPRKRLIDLVDRPGEGGLQRDEAHIFILGAVLEEVATEGRRGVTIESLVGCHWPGNVTELIGVVTEWASLGGELGRKLPQETAVPTDLEDVLFRAFHSASRGWNVPRAVIEKAKMRHTLTPFVVISPDSDVEYAVIISAPDISFIRDPKKMPMVNTVMTIDIAAYLGTAKPMA